MSAQVGQHRQLQALQVEVEQPRPLEAGPVDRRQGGQQHHQAGASTGRGRGDTGDHHQRFQAHQRIADGRRGRGPEVGQRRDRPAQAEQRQQCRDGQRSVRPRGVVDRDRDDGHDRDEFGQRKRPDADQRPEREQDAHARDVEGEQRRQRAIHAAQGVGARVIGPRGQVEGGTNEQRDDEGVGRAQPAGQRSIRREAARSRQAGERDTTRERQPTPDLSRDQLACRAALERPDLAAHLLERAPPEVHGQRNDPLQDDDDKELGAWKSAQEEHDLERVDGRRDSRPRDEETQPVGEVAREAATDKCVLEPDDRLFAGRLPRDPAMDLIHRRTRPPLSRVRRSERRPSSPRTRR